MLSPAKILWFPGMRVYGESRSFPGMYPGSCQAIPKNRTHLPSLLFSPVGKNMHWSTDLGGCIVQWKEPRFPGCGLRCTEVLQQAHRDRDTLHFQKKQQCLLGTMWSTSSRLFNLSIRSCCVPFDDVHRSFKCVHILFDIPPSSPLKCGMTEFVVEITCYFSSRCLEGIVISSLLCLLDCSL